MKSSIAEIITKQVFNSLNFLIKCEMNIFNLPPDDAETIEDFLVSLIDPNGRLSLRLLRSRNPSVESNNF